MFLERQTLDGLVSRLQYSLGVVCIGGLGGSGLCELQMKLKVRYRLVGQSKSGGVRT